MSDELKAKKILVLLGSPRKKGNSIIMAQQIINGAESVGAETESIFLHEKNIQPCKGCYACQKPDSKGCVQDDDMQALYPKLLEADGWVFASPVYWFSITAQTKLFLDRCFALGAYDNTANPFGGKRVAVAMSYGDVDPFKSGCVNALRMFQDIFAYVGANLVGMVYGTADKAGDINSNPDVLKSAERLGKRLAAGKRP